MKMNGAVLTVRRCNAPLIRRPKFTKVASEARAIVEAAIKSGKITVASAICKHHTCNFTASPGQDYCVQHGGFTSIREPRYEKICCHCGSLFKARQLRIKFCSTKCTLAQEPNKKMSIELTCQHQECGKTFKSVRYTRKFCYTCAPKS